MISRMIALFILMSFSLTSFAWGSLKKREIQGFYTYCYYTDGGVSTVSSTAICPISNQAEGSNSISPVINIKKNMVAPLKSQYVKSFNRYCTYQNGAIITINQSNPCPISSKSASIH
ncbi:MAG: hypothetical protein KAH18_03395 [Psychromonas sp.]|nr:hypothetical protein [Psychromonas sp.]